jgi:tetratricopeptide (TPR) repeat protein
MNAEFLARLAAAQTEDERSWLVTELRLSTLSEEARSLVWAAVIPHWFDENILAALRPELADRISGLLPELLALSFVESLENRGYRIHDLTRKLMLDRLWSENQAEFKLLSQRAADYFETQSEDEESQIESVYHQIGYDADLGASKLRNLAWTWQRKYRRPESELLLRTAQELLDAGRGTAKLRAETIFADGRLRFRFYEAPAALERLTIALELFREIADQRGEANTLQAIGDVLQFLDQRQDALNRYETAIEIYRAVGARLGEANTLKAIGDVLQFLKQSQDALNRYETAIEIYRAVGDRLGEANTLQAIGDVLQFLNQRQDALNRYETAIEIYRAVGDRLGEANTLKAIGDVLQFLDQRQDALNRYETAIEIYRAVGDRLGEANTLKAIGDVLQFLDQRQDALNRYETAIEIYRAVGDRLGEANTLKAIGDVLQFLKQSQDALNRYETAIEIYRAVGARLGEANTLQAIGDCQSDSQLAITNFFEPALAIYQQIDPIYSQARLLTISIAPAYRNLNQLAQAKAAYETALDLWTRIDYELGQRLCHKALQELANSDPNKTEDIS